MPSAAARRQPESRADAWFSRGASTRLLHAVQREVIPDLTRVFGHTGLYLRPTRAIPSMLSGNLLAEVISLHREGRALGGDLACEDGSLPLADASLSLVYGLCVFETSPEPDRLLAEVARVLKPEGVALLVTLNPWAIARARWSFRGLHSLDPGEFAARVGASGLDVQRRRFLGPYWSAGDTMDPSPRGSNGLASPLRMASLVVARRRDPGVTPLRATSPALKFRPGMSAG